MLNSLAVYIQDAYNLTNQDFLFLKLYEACLHNTFLITVE